MTYWNRTVDDLLVNRLFQPSGGFLQQQLDNLGTMKAHGFEIAISGTAVNRPRLSLDLFANASYTRERITDMGGAPDIKVGYYRYSTWHKEGYAPGALFGPLLDTGAEYPINLFGDCTAPSRDELLDYLSEPRAPENFLPLVQDCGTGNEKLHYMGKPTPNWNGVVGGDLRLGNFTISNLFQFSAGDYRVHNITNEFRRSHASIGRNVRAAAQAESTLLDPASTPEERLDAAMLWATELFGLSPYDGFNAIEKADHLRWQELSVTFQVPGRLVERFGARHVYITAAARNLMLWTPYSGIDPSTNVSVSQGSEGQFFQGLDGWSVGIPRRLQLSTRIGF